MYITTISLRRGHTFDRDQGEAHGKFWKDERKGGNEAIIISKIKSNSIFFNLTCSSYSFLQNNIILRFL